MARWRFSTSRPPPSHRGSEELLACCERQLWTYADILEVGRGEKPDRLLLYWTSEARKSDALMGFPYRPGKVEEAGRHFDAVVEKIQDKDSWIVPATRAGYLEGMRPPVPPLSVLDRFTGSWYSPRGVEGITHEPVASPCGQDEDATESR
jgi:hypothetical protein